eukprot:Opistho-2@641
MFSAQFSVRIGNITRGAPASAAFSQPKKMSYISTEGGDQNRYAVAYVTCPDTAVARSLADGLVEKKLAACVAIMGSPITSIYRWQGKLEEGSEIMIMIKTTKACMPGITDYVKANHPYEVPEIIQVPIQGGLHAYLGWIDENTQNRWHPAEGDK